MLYIVLALVLAAFGLLIAALTTANTLWAWISVVLSVVAAALLITDWISGRRRARAQEPAKPTVVTVGGNRPVDRPVDEPDEPDESDSWRGEPAVERTDHRAGHRADRYEYDEIDHGDVGDAPAAPPAEVAPEFADTGFIEPVPADDDGEPGEEPTDASDLLVVSDLSAEVRVVDEHRRYHLANCTFLTGKATIPIAVSEARQLGFTPCARCGPDAVLAARYRAGR